MYKRRWAMKKWDNEGTQDTRPVEYTPGSILDLFKQDLLVIEGLAVVGLLLFTIILALVS
jgi:hypothetical protein